MTSATVPEPDQTTTVIPPASEPESISVAQLRSVQADATITKHVALATGTGFIPVPIFDIVATTGVQADLLFDLFKIYGHKVSKERARSIATVLIGSSIPSLAARSVASGLKLIPGVGTALGFFTSPSLAGASTYVVGKVVQEHLVGGGTPLNLHIAQAKTKVKLELDKVKTKSTDLIDEGKERLGGAVAALRGKKGVAAPVDQPVEVVS